MSLRRCHPPLGEQSAMFRPSYGVLNALPMVSYVACTKLQDRLNIQDRCELQGCKMGKYEF